MANVIWNPGINAYNPTVELIVNQSSQSIDGNYSVLSYSLILHRPSNISSSASKSYSVTINGVTVASGATTMGGSGDKTIASGTMTVYHNADGTKAGVGFSFYMDIGITWSGSSTGNASGSGSMNLTTIPRASSITSISGGTLGSSVTVNIYRASDSFTHTVIYRRTDGVDVTVGTGQATSCVFTPAIDDSQYLPNNTSGTATIIIHTYNGGTYIGTDSKTFTVYVPSSVVPSVSISKSGVDLYQNQYVQSRSRVAVTLNETKAYGSSIVSRFTSVKSGNNVISVSSSNTFTSAVINYSGAIIISTIVTDSRGRTASASTTINMTPYLPPQVTGFSAFRSNPDGSPNPQGAHIRIMGSASISPINNTNTRVAILRHRLKGTTEWSEPAWSDMSYTPSLSAVVSADKNSHFEVQIYAADYFTNTTQGSNVGTAFVLMDFHSSGKGLAIGKVAEDENFVLDLNGEYRFNGMNQSKYGGNVARGNGELLSFWHGLETGVYFESPGDITGQPSDWGFMSVMKAVSPGTTADFNVLWFSQASGAIYRKSGNGTAMSGWVLIRDSQDFNSIVESGVNSNGYYMKYNNGNMICWHTFTKYSSASTAWGSWYYGEVYGLTFPATFADIPSVTASISGATESAPIVSWIGYGGLNVYGVRPVGFGAGNYSVRYIAIGRWK
jgi:hypothetical protein